MGIYGDYRNKTEWLEAFGREVQRHREQKGLAKNDVIAGLHTGMDTIRAVELGFGTTFLESLLRVANYVGMDLCDDVREIGRRIAACRAYRQKSRREVAEMCCLSERTIVNAEIYAHSMCVNTFLSVCEALNVAPMVLLKKEW